MYVIGNTQAYVRTDTHTQPQTDRQTDRQIERGREGERGVGVRCSSLSHCECDSMEYRQCFFA